MVSEGSVKVRGSVRRLTRTSRAETTPLFPSALKASPPSYPCLDHKPDPSPVPEVLSDLMRQLHEVRQREAVVGASVPALRRLPASHPTADAAQQPVLCRHSMDAVWTWCTARARARARARAQCRQTLVSDPLLSQLYGEGVSSGHLPPHPQGAICYSTGVTSSVTPLA